MEIIFTKTQQVVSEQEFRNMYPNTSFPSVLTADVLADYEAESVFEGKQVNPLTPYEYSFRNGVEEINGKYFTKYSIGPIFIDTDDKTADEQQAEYKATIDAQLASGIRNTRNQLLKDSDWTQISDATVDKDAWLAYRCQLRDITLQKGFPLTVKWPAEPV
jgi:hypothetical protein